MRITVASVVAFIVGETISPKLSLSNQMHMDTWLDVVAPSSTQVAGQRITDLRSRFRRRVMCTTR